jgi:hypothetical protein
VYECVEQIGLVTLPLPCPLLAIYWCSVHTAISDQNQVEIQCNVAKYLYFGIHFERVILCTVVRWCL